MKSLFLLFSIGGILAVDGLTNFSNCKNLCADIKIGLTQDVCAGAMNIRGQPGVYKSCNNGKMMGFEHACMPTCTGKVYAGRDFVPGNSFDVCRSERKKPTPNNYLTWCRRGYDITYKEVIDTVGEILNVSSEEKDEISTEYVEGFENSLPNTNLHFVNERSGEKRSIEKDIIKEPTLHTKPDVHHVTNRDFEIDNNHKEEKKSPLRKALNSFASPSKTTSGSIVSSGLDNEVNDAAIERSFPNGDKANVEQLELSGGVSKANILPLKEARVDLISPSERDVDKTESISSTSMSTTIKNNLAFNQSLPQKSTSNENEF